MSKKMNVKIENATPITERDSGSLSDRKFIKLLCLQGIGMVFGVLVVVVPMIVSFYLDVKGDLGEIEKLEAQVRVLELELEKTSVAAGSLRATVVELEEDVGALDGPYLKNLFEELNQTASTYKEGFESAGNITYRIDNLETLTRNLKMDVFDWFPRSQSGLEQTQKFTFGYGGAVSKSAFIPFTNFRSELAGNTGFFLHWSDAQTMTPYIGRGSSSPLKLNQVPGVLIDMGYIVVHPGGSPSTSNVVVRFNADRSGIAVISFEVTTVHFGSVTASMVLEKNDGSLSVVASKVLDAQDRTADFTQTIDLSVGDVIFFAINSNGDHQGDSVRMKVEVTL